MPAEPDMVTQNRVAEFIKQSDGVSATDIAKALGLTRGTVDSAITRLTYVMPIYEQEENRRCFVRVVKPMDWSDNGGADDET